MNDLSNEDALARLCQAHLYMVLAHDDAKRPQTFAGQPMGYEMLASDHNTYQAALADVLSRMKPEQCERQKQENKK